MSWWVCCWYSRSSALNCSAALWRTSASVIGLPLTTASTSAEPAADLLSIFLADLSWAEQAGSQTPRAKNRTSAPGISGLRRNTFMGSNSFTLDGTVSRLETDRHDDEFQKSSGYFSTTDLLALQERRCSRGQMAGHEPLEDALGGNAAQAQGGRFEQGLGEGQPGAPAALRAVIQVERAQDGGRRQGPGTAGARVLPAARRRQRRRRRQQVDGRAARRPGGDGGGEGARQRLHGDRVDRLGRPQEDGERAAAQGGQ